MKRRRENIKTVTNLKSTNFGIKEEIDVVFENLQFSSRTKNIRYQIELIGVNS